jgi:MFS family permease
VAGRRADSSVTDTAGRSALWRHRDFRYFWAGESVSMLGSAIGSIAMPLIGVLLLDLRAFEVGVLASASTLPGVLIGPFVGTIVDRVDRRRLMINTDFARAALIAWIGLAVVFDLLAFWQLAVAGGALTVLTSLFNVAHQAYLPNVVEERSLSDGNSKLEASQSVANISGPGLAGWLVGAGGPAIAMFVDALSYLVSALCLRRVRPLAVAEPAVLLPKRRITDNFWRDTKEGFALLWRDPVLRAVSISYSALALFCQIQMAVYMLFLVRWADFSPTMIGVVFSLSGVVGFFSALWSGRLAPRIGVGRLVVIGQTGVVAGGILLAAVAGSTLQAAGTMLAAEACFAAGMSFYGVGNRTMLQTRTEEATRGRVIGASRVLTGALVAVAGLTGGGIGALFGLRATLVVGAVGMFAALFLVLRRQVWMVDSPKEQAGAIS